MDHLRLASDITPAAHIFSTEQIRNAYWKPITAVVAGPGFCHLPGYAED